MGSHDRKRPDPAPDLENILSDESPNWESIWIDLGGEG
jgi:hypothetical protein